MQSSPSLPSDVLLLPPAGRYVVPYVGNQEDRALIREHEFFFPGDPQGGRAYASGRKKFHVLLTTYEILRDDQTKGRHGRHAGRKE